MPHFSAVQETKEERLMHFSAYQAREQATQPKGVQKLIVATMKRIDNASKKGAVEITTKLKNQNLEELAAVQAWLREKRFSAYDNLPYYDDDTMKKPDKADVSLTVKWEHPERGGYW